MKNLLVDADDTILDYTSGLLAYGGFDKPQQRYADIAAYLNEQYNLSYDEIDSLIVDFNQSQSFKHLKPFDGVVDTLSALKDDGVHIHVITSCGDSNTTRELRYSNLRDVFGDMFSTVSILPLMSRKINALMPFINNHTVFVEDTKTHYHDAHILGIPSYIFERMTNNDTEQLETFTHWSDFYGIYNDRHK
jgi:phosphoglycolate phosphatase-like HAD superfamily hydrolase